MTLHHFLTSFLFFFPSTPVTDASSFWAALFFVFSVTVSMLSQTSSFSSSAFTSSTSPLKSALDYKKNKHIKSQTFNKVIRMQHKILSEKATSIVVTVDRQLHKSKSSNNTPADIEPLLTSSSLLDSSTQLSRDFRYTCTEKIRSFTQTRQ